jgi:hypothetical protein
MGERVRESLEEERADPSNFTLIQEVSEGSICYRARVSVEEGT